MDLFALILTAIQTVMSLIEVVISFFQLFHKTKHDSVTVNTSVNYNIQVQNTAYQNKVPQIGLTGVSKGIIGVISLLLLALYLKFRYYVLLLIVMLNTSIILLWLFKQKDVKIFSFKIGIPIAYSCNSIELLGLLLYRGKTYLHFSFSYLMKRQWTLFFCSLGFSALPVLSIIDVALLLYLTITIFRCSKRHGIKIDELISANHFLYATVIGELIIDISILTLIVNLK